MTEEEFRAVAWETVIARIDDLASVLDAASRSIPQNVQQVQDVNCALSRLDGAKAQFRSGIASRLAATGWPGMAR